MTPGDLGPGGAWLVGLFDQGVTTMIGVVAAALVGVVHAVGPGHGKTLAAGYLLGTRGRPRDALWVGVGVAVAHTASVAVLAVGWWLLAEAWPDVAWLSAVLQLAVALVVVAVGVWLLVRRRRRADHAHHHPPPGRGGLVAVAGAGGLVPSPSAFLVLVTGLASGQAPRALAFLAAFAVGLAVTVALIGAAVVAGRDRLAARPGSAGLGRVAAALPTVSAVAVVLSGSALAVRSTLQLLG